MSIMSYGELSTSSISTAENNRCSLRRIARHEEPEFSNASILNSMEKFVRTVNEMEETILVPSRLLDLAVADSTDTICQKVSCTKQISGCTNNNNSTSTSISNVKNTFSNTDLYRLYNIVNQMKVELLWSQENSGEEFDQEHNNSIGSSGSSSGKSVSSMSEQSTPQQAQQHMGHARCPSTTSMQSVQSASSMVSSASSTSDSDSDTGIENDSGLESEEPSDRLANIAAENFRRHLRGLHRSINRMTEAAEYLTLRYQADVGGQV